MIGIKSKLKTKDYGLWTILSISVFLGIFFFGFILATPIASAQECKILSVTFNPEGNVESWSTTEDEVNITGKNILSWLNKNGELEQKKDVDIRIEVNDDCLNKTLSITLAESDYYGGEPALFTQDNIIKNWKIIPQDNNITIPAKTGDDDCDESASIWGNDLSILDDPNDPECKYYIEIIDVWADPLEPIFYSHRDGELLVYDDDVSCDSQTGGLDTCADDKWEFGEITGAIQRGGECEIKSASFDKESVEYSDDSRPIATLRIVTDPTTCSGGTMSATIVADPEERFFTPLQNMNRREFIVPDDGIIEFVFKVGDEFCIKDPDEGQQCQYIILIERPGTPQYKSNSVAFQHNCDPPDCEDKDKWEIVSTNTEEVIEGGIIQTISITIPAITKDWYCKVIIKDGVEFRGPGGDVGFDTKADCKKECKKTGECIQPYELLEPLPGIGRFIDVTTTGGFVGYLSLIFQLMIGIAGVLAVIMLVIGGIEYMATGSITEKGNAKKRIGGAIGGLLLALAAFMILNTINPQLVAFHLFDIEKATISINPADEPDFGTIEEEISLSVKIFNLEGKLTGGTFVTIKSGDASQMAIIPFDGKTVQIHKGLIRSLLRIQNSKKGIVYKNFPKEIEADDKADLYASPMPNKVKNYNIKYIGGFADRKVKGTNKNSMHAFGLAIDINKNENPFGDELVTDMPRPEFVNLFKNEGWGWGGDWITIKDAMHFSKSKFPPQEGGDSILECHEVADTDGDGVKECRVCKKISFLVGNPPTRFCRDWY